MEELEKENDVVLHDEGGQFGEEEVVQHRGKVLMDELELAHEILIEQTIEFGFLVL